MYYIIFPAGDKNKLAVKEIESSWEKSDFDLASRKNFDDEDKAIEYARQLAKENNLQYTGNDDGYLD